MSDISIGPLGAAIIAWSGLVIGWIVNKKMDDRNRRLAAYADLMEAMAYDISPDIKDKTKARSLFLKAKQEIILYGSKKVIRHMVNVASFDGRKKEDVLAYKKLINVMRNETALFPWNNDVPEDLIGSALFGQSAVDN